MSPASSTSPADKRYDRAYFDRWYRRPRTRVHSPAAVARKVAMVVGVAEYLLGRRVRSVLDAGCGEGAWQPVLRRLRPGIRYLGIDPSAYAVGRFGRRRNVHEGTLERLDEAVAQSGERGPFDLVVCCDVLNYLPAPALRRGLGHVCSMLGDGIAYLELFTSAEEMTGDLRGWHRRPPAFYDRLWQALDLTPCGMHCYVGPGLRGALAALERTPASRGAATR